MASLPEERAALGLAAPQIGWPYRVFIIKDKTCQLIMINPVLVKTRGFHSVEEGCLSLPGKFYRLARPKIVKVRGQHPDGGMRTFKAHDLIAQAIMHEMDHLDGILIDTKDVPLEHS